MSFINESMEPGVVEAYHLSLFLDTSADCDMDTSG